MDQGTARAARVVRGLLAAAVALFVAAFSHVATGGGPPGVVGLALSAAFAAVVCVALARPGSRPRSRPVLLAVAVGSSQFVFHLLFGVGAGSGSGLVVAAVDHGAHTMATLVPALGASPGVAGHPHDPAGMWLGHAVAALVTVALLLRGEQALSRLLELAVFGVTRSGSARGISARFAVLLRLAATAPARRRLLVPLGELHRVDRLRELGVLLGALRHRGPPVLRSSRPAV